MKLILARIPGIENSRWSLIATKVNYHFATKENYHFATKVRRWHPDKFHQKQGHRIKEEHKEEVDVLHNARIAVEMQQSTKVMLRVKAVAQAINDFGKGGVAR